MAAPEGSEEGEIAESPAGPGSGFSSENRDTILETPVDKTVATTTLSSAVRDAPPQLEQDHAPWPVPAVLVNANGSTDFAARGYSTQFANTAWARGSHVEDESKSVYSTASDGSHDVSASDGERAPSGEASPGLKTKRDEETRDAVLAVVDDGEREEGELEEGEIPVEELGDFEASETVQESAPPAAEFGAGPEGALHRARSLEREGSKRRSNDPNIDGSPRGRLWAEARRRESRSPRRRSRERTVSRSPRREHRSGRAWLHRRTRSGSRSRERRRILERRERSLERIAERRRLLERRRLSSERPRDRERSRDRQRSSSRDRRPGYSQERARAVAGRREGWMDKPRQEREGRSPGGDRGKSKELGGERRLEEEPRSSSREVQARLLKEAEALAEKVTVEDAQK